MKRFVLFFITIATLSMSSCTSLEYFTDGIRENLVYNRLEVEKVQFYNSEKIVLKRNIAKEETQIASGTIRFENGEYFEEIIIPKKTKGVVVNGGDDYLQISFERGDHQNLRFDLNDDNKYQISADSWEENYGCVFYDTVKYYIVPSSANTVLMVNKELVQNYEKKKRVLKGRSVGR